MSHDRLPKLDRAQQQQLLAIARRSLELQVEHEEFCPAEPGPGTAFDRTDGVFVTLKKRGQLRGCIGHISGGTTKLPQSVAKLARSAAYDDPRFPSLDAGELPDVDIEVTVLTPLELIEGPEDIVVGQHGLVIEDAQHRGLLLPQVATENGWDRMEFLEKTCWKAGLSPDAWKDARIYRFEAIFFGEREESTP